MGSRPSPFKRLSHSFPPSRTFIALAVHSVSVSKYGHYTAQAQEQAEENLLDSGAKNNAFPILGRHRGLLSSMLLW